MKGSRGLEFRFRTRGNFERDQLRTIQSYERLVIHSGIELEMSLKLF